MANGVFNNGKTEIAKATTDLDGSTLKVMLVNSSYTLDVDQQFIDNGSAAANDPKNREITVGGYARQTLTTKVVTQDLTNDFAWLGADNPVFSSLVAGQTIGGAVLFRDTGTDTTCPLIAFYDLTDTATNGGNVTIQWASAANGGVLKLA